MLVEARGGMKGQRMESYPFLGTPAAMAGVLDYKGRPITKLGSGRWGAASFILVLEMAERVTYNGIMFNLISFMTGPLGEPTAAAAAHVTVWVGFASMFPIIGALVADTFLSRYRTILLSSLLYILGLGLLSLSAALANPSHCLNEHEDGSTGLASCPPTTLRSVIFYLALYLVALAQGGHRPCVQALGADQFDETDREENLWRSSFFNLWIFGLGVCLTVSPITLSYIEDSNNWILGFGIPCILLTAAFMVFLLGSRFYRCYTVKETSPYSHIARAFTILVKRRLFSHIKSEEEEEEHQPGSYNQPNLLEAGGEIIPAVRMEEAKGLLRLFPIWATCLGYTVVSCQFETFFTKQGGTLDRRIGSKFQVPAAGLQSLSNVTTTVAILAYDRIAVPLARSITGIPSGITKLQRIGTGLLLSVFQMVISALVEMKRLRTARESGLAGDPASVLPMSIMWLFPQYILVGLGVVFATTGMQEFFYDQVPDGLRSLGIALCLSTFGIGNFINSFLVRTIDSASRSIGGESWFSDNLNRAHLDYFYWLLALLHSGSFILFLFFARSYAYKQNRGGIGV